MPINEDSKALIERFVRRMKGKMQQAFSEADINKQMEEHVCSGYPAEEIIALAKQQQADLIVVGSHEKKGASRYFPGSVSLSVNAKAPCSVLTIRVPAKKKSLESGTPQLEDERLGSFNRPRLIAYLRPSITLGNSEQRKIIEEYCRNHHYNITNVIDIDSGKPGSGLKQALVEIGKADGLVISDLDRIIDSTEDKKRQLGPLVTHIWHQNKIIVSILDGIDSSKALGQETLIDLLNEWTDREEWRPWRSPSLTHQNREVARATNEQAIGQDRQFKDNGEFAAEADQTLPAHLSDTDRDDRQFGRIAV